MKEILVTSPIQITTSAGRMIIEIQANGNIIIQTFQRDGRAIYKFSDERPLNGELDKIKS